MADRTAWILTYTAASDEPRVIRQASSLLLAGWRVVVCGYSGRSKVPDEWTFLDLGSAPDSGPFARMSQPMIEQLGHKLVRSGSMDSPLAKYGSRLYYHSILLWQQARRLIVGEARRRTSIRPSLIIAHDYPTCPAADDLHRIFGAPMLVDSHEYMPGTRPDDDLWNRTMLPVVRSMEWHYFRRAKRVFTVSTGIAEQLTADLKLSHPAIRLRNTPAHSPKAFRSTSDPLSILYHGVLHPRRDLNIAIEAAAAWTRPAKLVLRGPGDMEYRRELHAYAEQMGCKHKVSIEPPVAQKDIIDAACASDIGYFVYRNGSVQRDHALPNKFFEYMHAGLCVLTSPLPAMHELLTKYGVGLAVETVSGQAVASAIDHLTPSQINVFKHASLEAARQLCWQNEERVFMDVVNGVVD